MVVMNRIRQMRASKSMTQQQVGDIAGSASKVVMSLIENGHVLPTKDTLAMLCDVLECSACDLYDVDDLDLASTVMNGVPAFEVSPEQYNEIEELAKCSGFDDAKAWFAFCLQGLKVVAKCVQKC